MRNSLESDVACGNGQRKKGFSSRFSIRRLIYSSPILGRRQRRNSSGSSKSHRNAGRENQEGKSDHLRDVEKGGHTSAITNSNAQIHKATSKTSVFTSSTKSGEGTGPTIECPLCLEELIQEEFCELSGCGHRSCLSCLQQYLRVEITESRISISCPECSEPMHPNEIRSILEDNTLFEKYEDFMVRRVLAVDPDTRYCPAPDCCFAVIASECASCPKIKCERPGCNSYFCYHCKAEWHPNQTCDAARAQRSPHIRSSSISYSQDSHNRDDVKPCPRCQILIAKMNDGSCNHMLCTLCGAEFCWLCMKEISDLHYLSPSGCTFWGKKPWSRKKKILWQLGTLVGAPVGIALVAGITVPAMVIGIPVWVGRKLYTRYKNANKHKRNSAIVGGVALSILVSPLLAGLAVGIGVPILLFYVYGVVPVSLCRSGGCGGSSGSDNDPAYNINKNNDNNSIDANSTRITNPSIGEASISLASGSQVLRDVDRESASTVALAGSLGPTTQKLEVQADLVSTQRLSISSLTESVNTSLDDGGASTRALAGSVLNYKTNGSDACSCITLEEDCSSIYEKPKNDDNSTYSGNSNNESERLSIDKKCGARYKSITKPTLVRQEKMYNSASNENISMDIDQQKSNSEEKNYKYQNTTAALRKQFLSSMSGAEPLQDPSDCKIVIQISDDVAYVSQPLSVISTVMASTSAQNLQFTSIKSESVTTDDNTKL